MNYYIRDCNGQIIGNPKGYATFRGASQQEKRLSGVIWARFYAKQATGSTDNHVSSISRRKDDI